MKDKVVTKTKGDQSGKIDELINFLFTAKEKGATHYRMEWSQDPLWCFKWFETYRQKTEEEKKKDEQDRFEIWKKLNGNDS